MSDPRCSVTIEIYNKKMYDFLRPYALNGTLDKGNLVLLSVSSSNQYPFENLSVLHEREWDENFSIRIVDSLGGNVYEAPEGVYDIIPCFLIALSSMYKWDRDTFIALKEAMLKEKSEIEKCFDKVIWKTEWFDNRYSWDGIYQWTEEFTYDRFSDESKHIKTTHKYGLDLEKNLKNLRKDENGDDEYEKKQCERAIKKRSKYSNYDWDKLYFHGDEVFLDTETDVELNNLLNPDDEQKKKN